MRDMISSKNRQWRNKRRRRRRRKSSRKCGRQIPKYFRDKNTTWQQNVCGNIQSLHKLIRLCEDTQRCAWLIVRVHAWCLSVIILPWSIDHLTIYAWRCACVCACARDVRRVPTARISCACTYSSMSCMPVTSGAPSDTTRSALWPSKCEIICSAVESFVMSP